MNSIEITDSDDDMPERTIEIRKSEIRRNEAKETSPDIQNETKETLTNKSSPSSYAASNSNLQTTAQVRHRSRKTQHTVRNAAENEIQFDGVPLDEDGNEQGLNDNDSIKSVINNMMESEEVQKVIQRIANERVRCNFLLATYQLADMNFSLNTNPEQLRHQFRERLKRKERGPTTQNHHN